MNKKYLMVSFEDPRMKKLSDVLGNKTCKKIIDMLAEKEATKTEIAKALKAPLNTIEYNVNKLVEAGLVERSKNYFWSEKGKKIGIYKISNKSIVISPKSKNYFKPILPAALISLIFTFFIWLLSRAPSYSLRETATEQSAKALEGAAEAMQTQTPATIQTTIQNFIAIIPSWGWFLIGSLIALAVYIIILIVSWKRLIKL